MHVGLSETDYRTLAEKYGINRPGGQFFVAPRLNTWFVAFNHDRRAFNGPGRIPLEKAINYAIDRPELARAFGYLAGKRTDQLLPPDLARPTSIYPLKGADPATARKWLARARPRPDTLVLYATTNASSVRQAQVLALNLKQIGIDLEVKYFDALLARLATRGDPSTSPWSDGLPTTRIRPRSSSRFSRVVAAWASTSTTHASTRESRPRTV